MIYPWVLSHLHVFLWLIAIAIVVSVVLAFEVRRQHRIIAAGLALVDATRGTGP